MPSARADDEAGQRAPEARADVLVELARAERGEEVPEDLERREDVVGQAPRSAASCHSSRTASERPRPG